MFVAENSVVGSEVIIILSIFMDFSFKLERKITKNINDKIIGTENEYKKNGEKKFCPDKIQRIISNIESLMRSV